MFSPEIMATFYASLDIMWMGMLGIFTVILVIMGIVVLLSKFTSGKKASNE